MAVILFGRGGWLEPFFAARGIQIVFAVPSMAIVTMVICIPFVIRELDTRAPGARHQGGGRSRALGASSLQTFFQCDASNVRLALLYGVALTTARPWARLARS